MADKVSPEDVTTMDHVKHDMKMGRFPNQSSVETFLAEREVLAAQEKMAHLPSGPSERGGESDLAALNARATPGKWSDLNVYNSVAEDRDRNLIARRQQCRDDRAFLVALVNAYRSGKLKEATDA